ncbi:hypothetical protein DFH09DRAFT_547932 [Mycena vulgaris]|nr:hypothetical protein DFH09DRAFT_547932 [Mycena vulgaris]
MRVQERPSRALRFAHVMPCAFARQHRSTSGARAQMPPRSPCTLQFALVMRLRAALCVNTQSGSLGRPRMDGPRVPARRLTTRGPYARMSPAAHPTFVPVRGAALRSKWRVGAVAVFGVARLRQRSSLEHGFALQIPIQRSYCSPAVLHIVFQSPPAHLLLAPPAVAPNHRGCTCGNTPRSSFRDFVCPPLALYSLCTLRRRRRW